MLSYFQYGKGGFFLFVISKIDWNSASWIMSFTKKATEASRIDLLLNSLLGKTVSVPVVTN